MTPNEMDSEDVFHVDFTTVTPLEVFIAKLEEIFIDWGLRNHTDNGLFGKVNYNKGKWLSQSEVLTMVDSEALFERDIEFKLTRYTLDCQSIKVLESTDLDYLESCYCFLEPGCSLSYDLLNFDNDFCRVCLPPNSGPHPLSRWYGIGDFVVLAPQNMRDVDSENRVKTLLSCLQIALDDTECGVPVFLQHGENWELLFQGFGRTQKFHINFEMIHLERMPSCCKDGRESELLRLFESKTDTSVDIHTALRYTFRRNDWPIGFWKLHEKEPLSSDNVDFTEIASVPFGSRCELVDEVLLIAVWPHLSECSFQSFHNVYDEGEFFSKRLTVNAPVWQTSIIVKDEAPCFLSDCFSEFMTLTQQESKMIAVSRGLSGLRGLPSSKEYQPIPNEVLMTLLYYIFPDADEEAKSPVYFMEGVSEKEKNLAELRLKGMKTAPYGSLPWRLAIVMAHTIYSLGGQRAAEYLWNEFTQELVFRCERNILIPGVKAGYPDPRSCLLYQKLQLLNCCIQRRIDRDRRDRRTEGDSDSEPEEYYDAEEVNNDAEFETKKHPLCFIPTGRLSRHGQLRLLETGEPLYVPKTQDPVPRTEDQLEEHADVLLQLGTDEAASALRANLLSASLLADMEAFKAANPGCILADFIRWFSPRDWIEDDEGVDEYGQCKGHLSARMTIPGNTWQEVWQVSKPVPARKQRRLFDDTKEMEKALQFFEVQTPKGFATLLLPTLTSTFLLTLAIKASETCVPGLEESLNRIIKKAEHHSRMITVVPRDFEEVLKDIQNIEKQVLYYKSIYNGLMGSKGNLVVDEQEFTEFVGRLVIDDCATVPGKCDSPFRNLLQNLFVQDPSLPEAFYCSPENLEKTWSSRRIQKEVILRKATRLGPNRLYVDVKPNEVRLCGAFSELNIERY